jgi:tripartite-type tricarboxylate transporter receptor subunit TctC
MGEILGVKVRVIHGYQGTRTSLLAMQRGELDGVCGIYMSTIRSQFDRDLAAGEMNVFIAFDHNRIKEFPDVPTIFEIVKNPADRQLAELIFGQNALSRPISAPPGVSAERRTALRTGLMAAMTDRALLEEAKKLRLEIVPMTGEETERRFQAFYDLPEGVVTRARTIIGGR